MNSISGKNVSKSNISKFAILSLIGAFLFLVPVKYLDSFNIPVGIVIDWIKSYIHEFTIYVMLAFVSINALLSLISYIFKPKFILEHEWLSKKLATTPFYLISRILGAIIIWMVFLQIGPEQIISAGTGGTMVDLTMSLVSVLIVISYAMPLITDFGIMEFTGVLIKDFVKPLFTVPGRSAVDLMTSWFGASNAAVLLTEKQYNTGYYTAREAAVIMTNFSVVSIPFCYIVTSILGVQHLFTQFYIILVIVGFTLALIMPRIPPLSNMPDTYNEETGKMVNEEVPEGKTKFQFALELAAVRAEKSNFSDVIKSGSDMFLSVLFILSPIIISWGTISLILVEYTPIFKWLSYPIGFYLNILGIEQAYQVAPAALVGFADMFIPALILAPVTIVKTKFVLGILSLIQIIYLTEVGIIIIQSKVPLGFKELFIIFLERTIIAIPLIILLTNIIL